MKNHNHFCISNWKKFAVHVLAGIAIAAAFGLIFGFLVELLWNCIVPDVFGLKQITYWQAVGLVIMFRLLFGSHGHGGHSHNSEHHRRAERPREVETSEA